MRLAAEYVLPLRWLPGRGHPAALSELAGYLRGLAAELDVTVVDGSPDELRALHGAAFGPAVRLLHPKPPTDGAGPRDGGVPRNGKAVGVNTGVRAARHERVVIADDDVRYRPVELRAVLAALDAADLVRPQNYFDPAPWHARWDTGRSLLNRALGADYPGTLAIRRSTFTAMGGYDDRALFENLELSRTVRAFGGREAHLPGVYVRRLPPSTRRFLSQRVRQAYDSTAQPGRWAVELAMLPAGALALGRPRRWLSGCALVLVAAEVGRRRAGGRRVYGPWAALWALPWTAERALCAWLAAGCLMLGGVRYCGQRMRLAAHSVRWLRLSR